MEKRDKFLNGVAIGLAVAAAIWLCMIMGYNHEINASKVIPSSGYEIYVTIEDGKETYEGNATILGKNEEITVIQMEGQIYIAPTSKVVYE